MNNDTISADKFVHEQSMLEPFSYPTNEASFVGVFKILTPQLLVFFLSRGWGPGASEALSQKVLCELEARMRTALGFSSARYPRDPVVIQLSEKIGDQEELSLRVEKAGSGHLL
jgi:hypothetical protein